jgi:hypothetical protein
VTHLDQKESSQVAQAGDAEAIAHLSRAVASGEHWYIALLEAIRLWDSAEEKHNGRDYHYLIDDEALDLLLLAERLCQTLGGLLPDDEKIALLFYSQPPLELPAEQFKELIGTARHSQYLNYFYGVTVEETLPLAVQEEIRKERRSLGDWKERDSTSEVFRRIYGDSDTTLFRQFRREKRYPQRKSTSLTELKEFTYWLFKLRLRECDKARVASDTKKALQWLNNNSFLNKRDRHHAEVEYIDVTSTA